MDAVATWRIPAQQRSRLVWFADHRVHGVIGAGELRIHSRAHRQAEIAYVVHPAHWRRGYATWIGSRLLETAFGEHEVHRVFATCDPRNTASRAVLQKLGMAYEGRLRHTLLLRDGWRDSEMFSILETDWSAVAG